MIHQALHEQTYVDAQRETMPTAAIIDSQSVKTAEVAANLGFDGHKKLRAANVIWPPMRLAIR